MDENPKDLYGFCQVTGVFLRGLVSGGGVNNNNRLLLLEMFIGGEAVMEGVKVVIEVSPLH